MRFRKDNRGSATLESIISLTAFVLLFALVVSVVNFFTAQATMHMMVTDISKEMSQYSYIYSISGLEDLSNQLNDAAKSEKPVINDLIGTFTDLNNSIKVLAEEELGDDGIVGHANDNYNQILDTANAFKSLDDLTTDEALKSINEVTSSIDSTTERIEEVSNQVGEIRDQATDVYDQVYNIAQDPAGFAKTIAVVLGQQVSDRSKSFLAGGLSKAMSVKYLGGNKDEANAKLVSMGVANGLDGLNFTHSQMFHSLAPDDIIIAVQYEMNPFAFLNIDYSVNMMQSAHTRAWLSGDDRKEITQSDPKDETSKETSKQEDPFSIWEMGNFDRGRYIKSAELNNLGSQYLKSYASKVDAFNPSTSEAVHVTSLDTFAKTYQDEKKLISELKTRAKEFSKRIDEINEVKVVDKSYPDERRVVTLGDNTRKNMVVVVPNGADLSKLNELKADIEDEIGVGITFSDGYGKSKNDSKNDNSEDKADG